MARTRRDEIEYMRPPRPTEAAITCTKVRKCFTKYLSVLQSRPFCWLRYVVILEENPAYLFFAGALFALRAAVVVSTETKDIPLCEGQYSCQTSAAGHVLQSPKRYGTLSPNTRTLTHRLAFYTLVSTRLGPIQPIVPNSRAPRARETLSTSSNSIFAKSSSTSASVPSSYASRASKKIGRAHV